MYSLPSMSVPFDAFDIFKMGPSRDPAQDED